jgi:hypothetical protein
MDQNCKCGHLVELHAATGCSFDGCECKRQPLVLEMKNVIQGTNEKKGPLLQGENEKKNYIKIENEPK